MDEKEIYNLLDSGWIYCVPLNNYYEDSFFKHISTRDKIKFGKGYFVRKTKSLYERLVSIGMPGDSDGYDSCVVIFMDKKGSDGIFNLMSLRESGDKAMTNLTEVARNILKDGQ